MDKLFPEVGGFDPADVEKNKTISGLAYFLFFLPLVSDKDSQFGRFHANQSLVFVLLCIVYGIINAILTSIFTAIAYGTGSIALLSIWGILSTIIGIVIGVCALICMIKAFMGKACEAPVIGKIKIIK